MAEQRPNLSALRKLMAAEKAKQEEARQNPPRNLAPGDFPNNDEHGFSKPEYGEPPKDTSDLFSMGRTPNTAPSRTTLRTRMWRR